MILYADSSSIVSLHAQEPGRHVAVREAVAAADFVSCSGIGYAEVRAGLARARRQQRIDDAAYDRALRDFHRDWRRYMKVQPSNRLLRLAGDLAEKHALRGYDAVHLASALTLRDRIPDTVAMSTWDSRLSQAAAAEGFSLVHEAT